jgi:hypothetical protein
MVINQRLEQLLSTNGDGTGTVEMAGAAAVYKITPPAGWTYELHRLNAYIEDDGKFFKLNVQDDLGAVGAALVSHLVQIQGGKYWTG